MECSKRDSPTTLNSLFYLLLSFGLYYMGSPLSKFTLFNVAIEIQQLDWGMVGGLGTWDCQSEDPRFRIRTWYLWFMEREHGSTVIWYIVWFMSIIYAERRQELPPWYRCFRCSHTLTQPWAELLTQTISLISDYGAFAASVPSPGRGGDSRAGGWVTTSQSEARAGPVWPIRGGQRPSSGDQASGRGWRDRWLVSDLGAPGPRCRHSDWHSSASLQPCT